MQGTKNVNCDMKNMQGGGVKMWNFCVHMRLNCYQFKVDCQKYKMFYVRFRITIKKKPLLDNTKDK